MLVFCRVSKAGIQSNFLRAVAERHPVLSRAVLFRVARAAALGNVAVEIITPPKKPRATCVGGRGNYMIGVFILYFPYWRQLKIIPITRSLKTTIPYYEYKKGAFDLWVDTYASKCLTFC